MAGKPEMLKKINLNLICRALITLHSATRLELAEQTGISLTTVRALLDELLAKEQIVETRLDESSGGRRAQRYALNPEKNLILSLHVKNGCLTYQVVNLDEDILETGTRTMDEPDWTSFIIGFIEACSKKWSVSAIGIGAPGVVENGNIYTGCEIGSFDTYIKGAEIWEHCHIPVVLENDLNTVAYGYAIRFLAEHSKTEQQAEEHSVPSMETVNLAYVNFDRTGTGAGFVVDGRILHGAGQFAGELGFMPVETDMTLDAAMNTLGDPVTCMDTICRVLAMIHFVTNPARIVIGGDRIGEGLVEVGQVEAYLKRHYLPERICPAIVTADCIKEDNLLGIRMLAFHHIQTLLPICDIFPTPDSKWE